MIRPTRKADNPAYALPGNAGSSPCVAASLCALATLVISGCANFVETRSISAFTEALQTENFEELKSSASGRFADKALRRPDAVEDFSLLKLPKGDLEVTKVDEVSEFERRVTGRFGKSSKKFRFKLVKNSDTGKWVVDDIILTRERDGVTSHKPVTELMDLVATVREFLSAWDQGHRREMLRLAEPDLARIMASIPPAYLKRLAEQTIGDRASETRLRPEVQMDEDVAVVRLPRKSGQMVISFRKLKGTWRVDDLAVESRRNGEHIGSVRQFATAATFLDAYNGADKEKLKSVTRPVFFDSCLQSTRLSTVPLPTAEAAATLYDVRLESGFADFMIPLSNEIVKLSMVRIEGEDSETPVQYLVDEVTLYELDGSEQKRLSAMFLSHAMVQIFSESLSLRELDSVRLMSTADFRREVWERPEMDDRLFLDLPMVEIENVTPRVLSTIFMGPVTHVTVSQGSRALVYVLHDQGGQLFVHDVLMPVVGRPNSLRQTLAVMIPVLRFAEALKNTDIESLQRLSSRDLNHAVWHTERVPRIGLQPADHFAVPLRALEFTEDRAVASFGDDYFGARVLLVREGDLLVLDDVRLISGPEDKQRVDMKAAMRTELSRFRGGKQSASNARPR